MKKVVILTLALALAGAVSASAQKFARINMQEVVAQMPEFKEMQTNLEAFGKDLQEQLEQIQVEFNNKAADLQKNQATMAASVRQMKQQELEQLQGRYAEFQRIAQEDFQKKQEELFLPIRKKAIDAVNKIAKAGGYISVFDTSANSLAYIDEAAVADLGPAVIAEIGAKTEASAPAAPAAKK